MALPFDLDRLQATGPPLPVLQELASDGRSFLDTTSKRNRVGASFRLVERAETLGG